MQIYCYRCPFPQHPYKAWAQTKSFWLSETIVFSLYRSEPIQCYIVAVLWYGNHRKSACTLHNALSPSDTFDNAKYVVSEHEGCEFLKIKVCWMSDCLCFLLNIFISLPLLGALFFLTIKTVSVMHKADWDKQTVLRSFDFIRISFISN